MDGERAPGTGGMTSPKVKDLRSMSRKEAFVRADEIDLKSLDIHLDKRLSKVYSRNGKVNMRQEEWEIDLSELDIKRSIARGTFGTVYKAVYNGQDVAGSIFPLFYHEAFICCH